MLEMTPTSQAGSRHAKLRVCSMYDHMWVLRSSRCKNSELESVHKWQRTVVCVHSAVLMSGSRASRGHRAVSCVGLFSAPGHILCIPVNLKQVAAKCGLAASACHLCRQGPQNSLFK